VSQIKPGALVMVPERDRPWRVVYVNPELGFARLEPVGEAWIKKSRVFDLDALRAYVEISDELSEAIAID
jgi:hypothetical protein